MIIGCPKEIKNQEYRVAVTPMMVREFKKGGHDVWIESLAGAAVGYSDAHYVAQGAKIVTTAEELWKAEFIIKVKEPQTSEFALMKAGQILFCYLHLAPNPVLNQALIDKKVVAIAFETVKGKDGGLPLLAPMSQIAGRLSIQAGALCLQQNQGGKGILLGGVPGVLPAKVVVIGGGMVGTEAARMALGLGAEVTLLDTSVERLQELDLLFGPRLKTLHSSTETLEAILPTADLVIGAVLIPGQLAPRLVTRAMLRKMEKGTVMIDVSIDQGGCFETSRPTTHDEPTYVEEGVIHYCVTNMPGACARTATLALANATTFYALKIANKGVQGAIQDVPGLRDGLVGGVT